jgi:hypothetical protein
MNKMRNQHGILFQYGKGREFTDLNMDGRIMLK